MLKKIKNEDKTLNKRNSLNSISRVSLASGRNSVKKVSYTNVSSRKGLKYFKVNGNGISCTRFMSVIGKNGLLNKDRLTYFFNANYMYFVKNSKVVLVLRLIDVFNILLLNPFNQRAWDSIISYGNDNAVVKSINPTVAPPKVGAGEIKALVPVVTAGDSEGSNNDIPPGSDVTTTNGEGLFDKLNYDALRTCAKIIGTVLVTGGTLYVGYKIYTEGFNLGTLHSILRGIGIWGNLPERRRVPEFTESSPIDPNNIGGQNPEVKEKEAGPRPKQYPDPEVKYPSSSSSSSSSDDLEPDFVSHQETRERSQSSSRSEITNKKESDVVASETGILGTLESITRSRSRSRSRSRDIDSNISSNPDANLDNEMESSILDQSKEGFKRRSRTQSGERSSPNSSNINKGESDVVASETGILGTLESIMRSRSRSRSRSRDIDSNISSNPDVNLDNEMESSILDQSKEGFKRRSRTQSGERSSPNSSNINKGESDVVASETGILGTLESIMRSRSRSRSRSRDIDSNISSNPDVNLDNEMESSILDQSKEGFKRRSRTQSGERSSPNSSNINKGESDVVASETGILGTLESIMRSRSRSRSRSRDIDSNISSNPDVNLDNEMESSILDQSKEGFKRRSRTQSGERSSPNSSNINKGESDVVASETGILGTLESIMRSRSRSRSRSMGRELSYDEEVDKRYSAAKAWFRSANKRYWYVLSEKEKAGKIVYDPLFDEVDRYKNSNMVVDTNFVNIDEDDFNDSSFGEEFICSDESESESQPRSRARSSDSSDSDKTLEEQEERGRSRSRGIDSNISSNPDVNLDNEMESSILDQSKEGFKRRSRTQSGERSSPNSSNINKGESDVVASNSIIRSRSLSRSIRDQLAIVLWGKEQEPLPPSEEDAIAKDRLDYLTRRLGARERYPGIFIRDLKNIEWSSDDEREDVEAQFLVKNFKFEWNVEEAAWAHYKVIWNDYLLQFSVATPSSPRQINSTNLNAVVSDKFYGALVSAAPLAKHFKRNYKKVFTSEKNCYLFVLIDTLDSLDYDCLDFVSTPEAAYRIKSYGDLTCKRDLAVMLYRLNFKVELYKMWVHKGGAINSEYQQNLTNYYENLRNAVIYFLVKDFKLNRKDLTGRFICEFILNYIDTQFICPDDSNFSEAIKSRQEFFLNFLFLNNMILQKMVKMVR